MFQQYSTMPAKFHNSGQGGFVGVSGLNMEDKWIIKFSSYVPCLFKRVRSHAYLTLRTCLIYVTRYLPLEMELELILAHNNIISHLGPVVNSFCNFLHSFTDVSINRYNTFDYFR